MGRRGPIGGGGARRHITVSPAAHARLLGARQAGRGTMEDLASAAILEVIQEEDWDDQIRRAEEEFEEFEEIPPGSVSGGTLLEEADALLAGHGNLAGHGQGGGR